MKEILKESFNLISKNPSAFFCLACIVGTWYIYQDLRYFITEQQIVLKEISHTQTNIQRELAELNVRINQLEKN